MPRYPTMKIYSGTVRSPLGYGIEKQLTANPVQQAQQQLKSFAPKGPKLKLPGARKQKGKSDPFYGE